MQTLGQMGNSFQVADIISKEALRLLRNNLVFKDLVYNPYMEIINKGGNGKTVHFKKPFRTKTSSGKQFVAQPLVDQTDSMTATHRDHFGVQLTEDDLKYTLQQYSDRYLKSGVAQIANKVDKSIADAIKVGSFFSYGTAGTAITKTGFAYARAAMNDIGVPDDGQRVAVLNELDGAVIDEAMQGVYNEKMVEGAIRKGYMGPISDFQVFRSSNLTSHTIGTHAGTPLTNGASQTGSELVTDGWTAGKTLEAGDVFTVSGVYEINPQNYTKTSRNQLKQFVVTEDCVADASGNMTIKLAPSINDGTNTTVDEDGNTVSLAAYQNVNAAVADGAEIVVYGTAATAYRQNLLFHKEACAFMMMDIEIPKSFNVKGRASHEGFSMAMVSQADINDYTEKSRIDAEWAVKLIYPELAMRYWSAAS